MLDLATLKELLSSPELGRKDKTLLVLASSEAPMSVAAIRATAIGAGLRAAKDWNLSAILSTGARQAIRVEKGWELNKDGRQRVAQLAGASYAAPTLQSAVSLRTHLTGISNPDVAAFLSEAITCLEVNQYRAAVVLSWVGAVAVLYDHVVASHLADFNAEAARRDQKWRAAKTVDDLARMKELDFLNILEAISVLGKNVRQELQNALQLRNACGHPSTLKIGAAKVASHIEILTLNVFGKF